MRHLKGLVLLCSVYLITVLLGLNTASFILPLMYPPPGEEQIMRPVVENPQDVGSAFWLFGYILAATVVMLVLMKRGWSFIINIALLLSFFSGAFFCLAAIVGDLSPLLTLILLALVIWQRRGVVWPNIALIFTLAGVGAILGASLGMLPVTALLVLLAVYDYISVFITKHMVTIAKESKGKVNLMFLVPVGGRIMGLGAGDIALPTTFAVSVLAAHGAGYAIPTAFGGLLGLVSLFYYLLDREDVTLPALPPIAGGLLIGDGLTRLILG